MSSLKSFLEGLKVEFSLDKFLGFKSEAHRLSDQLQKIRDEGISSSSSEWQGVCDEHASKMRACSDYLDSCGLRMAVPKWVYNKDDDSTWVSSPNFKFEHLL